MQQAPPLWKRIQRNNFTKIEELAKFLELDEEKKKALALAPSFSLNLPRRLAEKIKKNNLDDPIFKQFLPLLEEQKNLPGYFPDPVFDRQFQKKKKLLQKYSNRVLLLTTSSCAMHCRYCFRQNFPYETKEHGFEKEIEHIANDTGIYEVILSGGDPLSLDDRVLKELLHRLSLIDHITRIRFHTRFPIGIPERIDSSFLDLLASQNKQIYFVIHVNHSLELDSDVLAALKKVQKLGIPILTHTLLLKGVNNDELVLKELFLQLVGHGILPYYLFQLDRVSGSHRFEVAEAEGLALIKSLQESLSGYAIPKYVKEVPGAKSKTFIIKP